MHTHLSIHATKNLRAETTGTGGAPLQLRSTGTGSEYSSSEVTLYTEDQILTDRLVTAINEVCEARRKELQPATEQAA